MQAYQPPAPATTPSSPSSSRVPIEILRLGAARRGLSVEAYAAELDVEPAPETGPTPRQQLAAARAELGRQRSRALDRQRAKDERKADTAKRDEERRARFVATSRKRKHPCELLPNDVPATARQIVWRTERSAKSALRELLRLKRETYGAATEVAVFGTASTTRQRGRPFDALRSRRARRVVACAAVLHYLKQETSSPGRAFLVEGTLRGTFCSFFTNADTGDALHFNSLYGTQTDATRKGRWDCGALVALERAGAIEKIQPPAHTQRPRFVGRDRKGRARAINQYFLRNDVVGSGDGASVEGRACASWETWLAGRPARAARRAEARGP